MYMSDSGNNLNTTLKQDVVTFLLRTQTYRPYSFRVQLGTNKIYTQMDCSD